MTRRKRKFYGVGGGRIRKMTKSCERRDIDGDYPSSLWRVAASASNDTSRVGKVFAAFGTCVFTNGSSFLYAY